MKDQPIAVDRVGLVLDHQSYVPYYQQIVEQIREVVKAGKAKEGETFWSESDVSRQLGISKMPVRQAFQKLRSEGLLVIEKGKRPLIGSGRRSSQLFGPRRPLQRRCSRAHSRPCGPCTLT